MPYLAVEPLAHGPYRVVRTSTSLEDLRRGGRRLAIEIWSPTLDDGERHPYELLPGVGFTSLAQASGTAINESCGVIVFSHGAGGTALAYTQLCESWAANGAVVVSVEHPGNTLYDSLLGSGDEEAVVQTNRRDDILAVLAALDHDIPVTSLGGDPQRLTLVGHSFGAYGILAAAGAFSGPSAPKAIIGLQPYLRLLKVSDLEALSQPVLLLGADNDRTTPPALDIDHYLGIAPSEPRVTILERAGHQACSDVALYLDVLPQIEGIPEFVTDFLSTMAADITGTPGDPWRELLQRQVELTTAFRAELGL